MAQHQQTVSGEVLLTIFAHVPGVGEGLQKAVEPEFYAEVCAAEKEFDEAHWRSEPHSEQRARDKYHAMRQQLENKVKEIQWLVTFVPESPAKVPSE